MNKTALGVLATLLTVIVAVFASAASIPQELKPYLWLLFFLTLGALAAATYLQSRPEQPTNFLTLWSKLSESLHRDIEQSLASLQEARVASDPAYIFPTNLVDLPDFRLYDLHRQTVTKYDANLGKTLNEYLKMVELLHQSKTAYNQLVYADRVDQNELGEARSRMYNASRKLEQLIDSRLQPLITRCDHEILGDKSAP